jgi:hypothetical protein
LVVAVSLASASTITYTSGTVPAVTNIGLQLTELGPGQAVVFPQWDPASFVGQTLTGVSFSMFGHIEGQITLTNKDNAPHNVSATTNSDFYMLDANSVALGGSPSFTLSYGTGLVAIPANTSVTYPNVPQVPSYVCQAGFPPQSGQECYHADNSYVGQGTETLAQVTGAGTLSFSVSTLTGLALVGGGGQIGAQQFTLASAGGTVTYTYGETGIPEPATLLLLGSSLIALGQMLRRKKA